MMMDIFSSFDPAINMYFSLAFVLFTVLGVAPIVLYQTYWASLSPYNWVSSLLENTINDQTSRTLGIKISGFSKIIMSLFLVFILMNLLGLLPYVFSLSSHLIITLSLGVPLWMSLILSSFSYNMKYAAASLLPGGAPDWLNPFLVLIETTSMLARPLTLSFRLAANMTAGHVVLGLLGSYAISSLIVSPVSTSTVVILLTQIGYIMFEIGIAMIQAYIFCLLLTLYSDEHSSFMWKF